MADAAMYFIRHDEAQLHSTWGALGQTGLKSPRHYLSCLLINPPRGLSNALFYRCADAPTALGQRCHLVHQMRHGLIVHCRP